MPSTHLTAQHTQQPQTRFKVLGHVGLRHVQSLLRSLLPFPRSWLELSACQLGLAACRGPMTQALLLLERRSPTADRPGFLHGMA